MIPRGFLLNGVACGIKSDNKKDIGIIYLESQKSVCAGVFTKNRIKSASIIVSRANLRKTANIRAIVATAGIANTLTGKLGIIHANKILYILSRELGIKKEEIVLASTGKIGTCYDMSKVEAGIKECVKNLGRGEENLQNFAEAILTSDTKTKIKTINFKDSISLGIAKGAGMIYPNLATMLAFILTDLSINKRNLNKILRYGVENSFNKITIDGCMSTNDTVFVLSNPIVKLERRYLKEYREIFKDLCVDLSRKIVIDGEGASKLVKVVLRKVSTMRKAKVLAETVANSILFKAAIYGNNIKVGRILQAMGSQEYYKINLDKLRIYSNGKLIYTKDFRNDLKIPPDEETVNIIIDLGEGRREYQILTCDISPDYIKLNSTQ